MHVKSVKMNFLKYFLLINLNFFKYERYSGVLLYFFLIIWFNIDKISEKIKNVFSNQAYELIFFSISR